MPAVETPAPAQVQAPFNDAFAALDNFSEDRADDAPVKESPRVVRDDRGPDGKFVPKSERTKASPAKAEAKPKQTVKPEPKEDEKEEAETDDILGEPAEDKPKDDKPSEKIAPRQLREAYEQLKKKHAELELEHTKFKSKASEPDPEKKTLSERLAEREKRLNELEDEIRYAAYEKSSEYRDKYQTPFIEAYKAGRAKTASLSTTDEEGNIRKGTGEDFDALMRIVDDNEAAEFAANTFGNKASMVMYHRERVNELNNARTKAVEEYRSKGGERAKQMTEAQEKQRKEARDEYVKSVETATEKYPQWFKPEDGDDKGNELLDKGFHLADLAFNWGQPVRDGDKPLTPTQLAKLHAAIRNKAAGFDRLAYREKKHLSRIKELEAEIAKYKASEPGPGEGRRAGGQSVADDWESALNALAR